MLFSVSSSHNQILNFNLTLICILLLVSKYCKLVTHKERGNECEVAKPIFEFTIFWGLNFPVSLSSQEKCPSFRKTSTPQPFSQFDFLGCRLVRQSSYKKGKIVFAVLEPFLEVEVELTQVR